LQVNDPNTSKNDSPKSSQVEQKKLVAELKEEWKLMWSERFDDKIRAEGVSVSNYTCLRVEQGTIIHATKDFKALNFKEILKEHLVENPDRYVEPNNNIGGWNKFIKNNITTTQNRKKKRATDYIPVKPVGCQPKKGGRGWLHIVK
jgi:hypothetical protein